MPCHVDTTAEDEQERIRGEKAEIVSEEKQNIEWAKNVLIAKGYTVTPKQDASFSNEGGQL